jgi:hypothetical protein
MLHKDSITVAHVVAEVRRLIVGQLRLGKIEPDSIPDYCHDALQSEQYREEDWKRLMICFSGQWHKRGVWLSGALGGV